MATITSVNNTTPGATYDIHDPATWIGGVVPGPNDTVVFQSNTATTWFLTQSWTIQGITWNVSSNRSESGIEVPNTVSQNITFTQTVTSWYGSTTPMTANPSELRTKPWLKINNPVGTTFTLNLPGSIGYVEGSGSWGSSAGTTGTTNLISCTQSGDAILNIAGDVQGHYFSYFFQAAPARNAILINTTNGYTEVNCNNIYGGRNWNTSGNYYAYYNNALHIVPSGSGSTSSAEINCSSIGINSGSNYPEMHAAAIYLGSSLQNGVTLNVTGDILWNRTLYGNVFSTHTGGTLTINATKISPGTEPWTQGYNEDVASGTTPQVTYRRNIYLSGNNAAAVTIFNCDIYGPNNINNNSSTTSYGIVTSGAHTAYHYGNIYSSTLNRYQIPLYFDNETSLWYHMTGTAFVSINPIAYSTRTLFLGFTGGFYHANVVQANDPTNVYSPNRCPFIVPTLTPNPNYTGGNQLTWTYIKGAANRAETTTMINANYTGYSPAESNVRLGIVYGNGLRTGTCAVPLPSQVALGIGVDNTVGTWAGDINIIDQSSFADAVWNYNLTQITNTTNGTGQRLLNNATIESTGDQIAALGV